jgi:monoamine oxidase
VVVGAGLAGLSAADALARSGAEVVVLEARHRVGGRVWSQTLPNGAVVEMGAEFVLPGNDVLLGYVERFRLGLWDKGMRYGDREPRGGLGADRATLASAAAAVADRLASGFQGSAAQLLAEIEIDAGAREALLARCEVSLGNTADLVDARTLLHVAAVSQEPAPSVAGGNQQLALALAREVGSAIRLDSIVERIVWDEHRVRVGTATEEIEADTCVVAIPASVVGRIVFEPALPSTLSEALGQVVYGHAAKLFVPLREPAAPSAVLSVPERYWTWTATAGEARVQPVVSAFAGSAPALAGLRVAEGPDTWLASIARLRPDLALEPEGAVLSTWDDDPWVAGAYSTPAPSGPVASALLEPVGPLRFCGEHTSGEHAALMEGALRSGLRAAEGILRAVALRR